MMVVLAVYGLMPARLLNRVGAVASPVKQTLQAGEDDEVEPELVEMT
jgi:hypothetical protein